MALHLEESEQAFARGQERIPGGVNSPVRALKAVGGTPFFAASASGAWVTDLDGNQYVDYILSYGPMILGHGDPEVTRAVKETAEKGLSFGAPTAGEVDMAELLCGVLPGMDQVRLVNSGTEATMSAIRVARGYTQRDTIIKFTGCYHGHADYLLVKSGSGAATFGVPDSLGVPKDVARTTLSFPYNDPKPVVERLREGDVAAVILEPVAGNMGCIPPEPGFLETLREVCTETGTVLIFDEVMTGFRVGWKSAQGLYGVQPDMTCLGKVIGGGMPVGAYGGKAEIMDVVSPMGGVYQAGTLSGNPISVAAGLATLGALQLPGVYDKLEAATTQLTEGLLEAAAEAGVSVTVNRVGSMFTLFFGEHPIKNMDDTAACDHERFASFFHGMRERGVNLPPSQYEACFVSLAHTEEQISHTISAARAVFRDGVS
jgi:glutamate-1-semialdehyde 2,1-aminomutase